MVGIAGTEDLSLVLQTPEGPGMNDAIPVPLKVGPVRVGSFRIAPPAARFGKEAKPPNGSWAQII
jgi:hypothetical protein